MPLCILVLWAVASSGLANIDKNTKRKIMIGGAGVLVFFSLLLVHLKGMPYTWFRRVHVTNDTQLVVNSPTTLPPVGSCVPPALGCHPITHIAYIKTHKTGSSTIWSVLVKFALNNNLTIAIPATKQGNKLGWPESFTPSVAVPPKPDLLCYHSRYSPAMLDYMPKDTVYLTSLRDAAFQLKSAYDYFNASFHLNMSFGQFLDSPDKSRAALQSRGKEYFKWWLMNGQMYDLGLNTSFLSPTNPVHRQLVQDKIVELGRRFKLVLILERLDESLILMRNLLHWSTTDIIYFRKNFQVHNEGRSVYTPLQQAQARKWNWADDLVYSHFNKTLDRKLAERPEYYRQQVAELKQMTSLWMTRCVHKVVPASQADNKFLNTGYDGSIGTYVLTAKGRLIDECIQLAMTEVSKVRLLNSGTPINAHTFMQGGINNGTFKWR